MLPSREMAEKAFQALRDGGFVDASGFLVDDPRRTNWRDAVRPVVPEAVDSLVADASPVSEVLNVAWARHEFTDAHLEEQMPIGLGRRLRRRRRGVELRGSCA